MPMKDHLKKHVHCPTMKKNHLNQLALVSTIVCVITFSLTRDASAQTQGWDPNGTTSIGGNGTWNTNSLLWTPAGTTTQVASGSLVAFTPGDVALFCAGPSGSTSQGTFTITETVTNLLIAGLVNGDDAPGPCTVSIIGNGSLSVPAATTALVTYNASLGSTTIGVPITGVGPVEAESSGALILTATNTFTGGFYIGGSGGVSFSNNAAFGTGPISWLAAGFIQPDGTSAYNITNAMTNAAVVETIAGNAAGVTFSGPWTLPATGGTYFQNISGTITVAGPIGGTTAFTITNRANASWVFTGVNTFTGNLTNGAPLTIGGAGQLGSGNYSGSIINRTNLFYASSASQTLGGVISGVGTLFQQGPGLLTLTAVNAYTGNTSIGPNSTLIIGGTGSLGSTYSHNITNNGALVWTSSAGSTLSGVVSGSGSILQGGSGSSSISLTGVNTFTGTVTVTNGQVAFNSDASFGAVPVSLVTNAITLNGGPAASLRAAATSITLNTNRGIYLGTNGGQIQVASGDTLTYPGVISGPGNFQDGASTSTGAGILVLGGSNTYSGTTIIACGTLRLATNGALPAGTPLTIEAYNAATGSTLDLNGCNQTIGPLLSGTGIGGVGTGVPTILLTGALTILETNDTAFSGIISGNKGSLTLNGGTNTLTLNFTNTYTGPTIIGSGTLALGPNGVISNSPSISIAAGATFDVSANPAFSLTASNSLVAAGTTAPATINGALGGTVSFGSQPISLTYDGTDVPLTISQGTLVLNSNTFTVNGPALPLGTYTLISQASGTITSSGTFAVTGTAIPTNLLASIVVSNSVVDLVIAPATIIGAPGSFTGVTIQSDSTALLSFTGTPGATYILEATTNLVPPVMWTSLNTNTTDTNGVFLYDDTGSTNFPMRFYQTLTMP